jgi:hypothetical protein
VFSFFLFIALHPSTTNINTFKIFIEQLKEERKNIAQSNNYIDHKAAKSCMFM